MHYLILNQPTLKIMCIVINIDSYITGSRHIQHIWWHRSNGFQDLVDLYVQEIGTSKNETKNVCEIQGLATTSTASFQKPMVWKSPCGYWHNKNKGMY